MIFGIPVEQIIPFANFLGVCLLGVLAAFGLKFGKNTPTPADRQVEVAGAIVDNSAVRELAVAIQAYTAESIASRLDADKARKTLYRLAEVGDRLVDEISDMRRELGDLAKEIARAK